MGAGRLRNRHHHSGPAPKYEANEYKPDFDKLPSEAEYDAAEKKKEDDAPRS
jgi:hypothetical protein